MRHSLRTIHSLLVVVLLGGVHAASAQDRCATVAAVDAPRALVCRVVEQERIDIAVLQKTPTGASDCALTRTAARLELISGVITSAQRTSLPVYFTPKTMGAEAQRMELFAGQPDAVVLELEEGAPEQPSACYARANRAALSATAAAVSKAVLAYNQPGLAAGAVNLQKLANTWSWVITEGFGQYPWERAFNDLVHRPGDASLIADLPRLEWVVIHPSVGLTVSGLKALRESRGQTAVFIEPVGFVHYRFNVVEESRSYWGASSLVVLTQNASPAIGGLLRFNRYSIGAARHLRSGGVNGRWAVTATMELLERLQPARKKLKKAGAEAEARAPGH
ncbi:MAG: hypothetical protein ABIP90_00465 [Vicinamibacterales bacterium]